MSRSTCGAGAMPDPQVQTWGPRSHAQRASQLLVEVEAVVRATHAAQVELGVVERMPANADLAWTVALAHAHAATAQAMLGVEARS